MATTETERVHLEKIEEADRARAEARKSLAELEPAYLKARASVTRTEGEYKSAVADAEAAQVKIPRRRKAD